MRSDQSTGGSTATSVSDRSFTHDYDTGNGTVTPHLEDRTVEVTVESSTSYSLSETLSPALALRTANQIEGMPSMFVQFTNPDGVAKAMKAAVEWLKQESDIATDGGTEQVVNGDKCSEEDWRFEPDDIAREKHPQPSPHPGQSEQDRREYKIKRQLVDPTEGQRYYYVETEDGNTTLYSATVLQDYASIDESESRAFPRDGEPKITDGGTEQEQHAIAGCLTCVDSVAPDDAVYSSGGERVDE